MNNLVSIVLRLYARLMAVFQARWTFLPPSRSKILIFDSNNHHLLNEVLSEWQPEVLDIRGQTVNVPCLLRSFFCRGPRVNAYIDSYILFVKPVLIVTLADNNTRFLALRQRHAKLKTLFIQNGWRSYYSDLFETLESLPTSESGAFQVDYMLVFGKRIGQEYARYIQGKVVPAGSFKNNICPSLSNREENIIAFISQYNDSGIYIAGNYISHEIFFRKSDILVLECLKEYARVRGKCLVIIPRFNLSSPTEKMREEIYFRSILGCDCKFYNAENSFSSYMAVDQAQVSVSIDSTLAYESIARGNRTVIFSVRSALMKIHGYTFGWPADCPSSGFFWTNLPQPNLFIEILDRVLIASEHEWTSALEMAGFDDLMTYDRDNEILRSILKEELNSI